MQLKFKNVIAEWVFKKQFMAFNPVTTAYDETMLSPNFTFFFARPLASAKDMPALFLGGVTDASLSSSFDTDDATSRGFSRSGVAGAKNTKKRTGWSGEFDLTTLEMVNVEAHDMLKALHFDGTEVEFWLVHADKVAGTGLLDAEGTAIVAGRFADVYFTATIDESEYTTNAGDSSNTYEWTANLTALPDYSWVDPFPVEAGGFQKAVNRSLDKFNEANDIPDKSQRDRFADEYTYSKDASQAVKPTTKAARSDLQSK